MTSSPPALQPARSWLNRAGSLFWTSLVVGIPILAAVTCYNKEAEETARNAHQAAEQQKALDLLLNENTMVAEIDRRLREKIRPTPPFITVTSDFGSYAIPATTPWIVQCDFLGLFLTFSWRSGEDSPISSIIFPNSLNEEQCGKLLPVTAQRYAAYVESAVQKAAGK